MTNQKRKLPCRNHAQGIVDGNTGGEDLEVFGEGEKVWDTGSMVCGWKHKTNLAKYRALTIMLKTTS